MTLPQAVATPVDEMMESSELAPRINGFHLEPRCRICRNDSVRRKVNGLLATGASYAMVLRALGEDNAALDKGDRITIDSVRNHCGGIFQSKASPKRPTGTSSNAGLGRTASTSSRVWPPRSRPLRSSRRSWSKVMRPLSTRTPGSMSTPAWSRRVGCSR